MPILKFGVWACRWVLQPRLVIFDGGTPHHPQPVIDQRNCFICGRSTWPVIASHMVDIHNAIYQCV